MKALVEMNNMLKHENAKLKQEKQELIGFIKGIRYKPVALYPETQEMAEELGKVKLCITLLERLGE